jgi:hypothetical protein
MQRLRDEYATTGTIAMEIATIIECIRAARGKRAERLRVFDSADARAARRASFAKQSDT